MAQRRDLVRPVTDDLPVRLRRFDESEWLDVADYEPFKIGGSAVPRWRRYRRFGEWITERMAWAQARGLDVADLPDDTPNPPRGAVPFRFVGEPS